MNSIISDIYKSIKPEVGTPATFLSFTDRNPGTVSEIISPKSIRVEHCDHKAVPKEGGYEYGVDIPQIFSPRTVEDMKANPGEGNIYTLRKNGKWVLKGCPMDQTGLSVMIGHRDYYYDTSF